jgi:type II secretory pathway pseudopilin PulG
VAIKGIIIEIISLRSAMISLRRTNQGGSTLTFIIIAVVLAFAVVGTAFFVKQRGDQVRQQQAAAQADSLAKQAASKTSDSSTPATNDNKSDSTASTPVPTPSTPTPAATPAPTPAPTVAANDQSALPITGPESVVPELLAIGLLVASSAAYVVSRRALDRTL